MAQAEQDQDVKQMVETRQTIQSAPHIHPILPVSEIVEGMTLPAVPLYEDNPEQKVIISQVYSKKKIVIIGVPGAFTPDCHNIHLPGYVEHSDNLKKQGIHEILCVSVNDPYVMGAWADKQNSRGKVRLLADPLAEYTKAMGLTVELPVLGGIRSKRYSMVVNQTRLMHLKVETDPSKLSCSLVENLELDDGEGDGDEVHEYEEQRDIDD